jgi:hypothetical protein
VAPHPHVLDAYRENIEKLHTALSADVVDPEVVGADESGKGALSIVNSADTPPLTNAQYTGAEKSGAASK